jgi:hypothetical protein
MMNPLLLMLLLGLGKKAGTSRGSPHYPSPQHPPRSHPHTVPHPVHAAQAAPAAPTPAEAAPGHSGRDPKQAALELWEYVTHALKSPSSALKLARGPDETVHQAQIDMHMPVPKGQQGWYGAKTRAFGQKLIGRPFPPAPPQLPVHLSIPRIP